MILAPALMLAVLAREPAQEPVPEVPREEAADPPEYGYLTFSAGPSVGIGDQGLFEVGGEWRFPELWQLTPLVGATWYEGGDTFTYAGLRWEIPLGQEFYFAPGFAAGFYDQHAFNLGSPLEFRSSLEFGWQVDDSVRLGITAAHLSNSDLGSTNPGRDSVALTVSFRPMKLLE